METLTWGVTLAVFTNMLQFAFVKTKRARTGMPCCRKWGPFLCIMVAMFLCMADPTRKAVQGAWGLECARLDRKANPNSTLGIQNSTEALWVPLSSQERIYCHYRRVVPKAKPFFSICTWSGNVLLFVGIFWLIHLPGKVLRQWRAIRSKQRRAATGQEVKIGVGQEMDPEVGNASNRTWSGDNPQLRVA